ncbi:MAG TPA: gliding motility-associated C-terminal domain-containing protein [Puia sp.]|nr:gliding motility-associated C-terminal domain-containing protein [Puia sp.]
MKRILFISFIMYGGGLLHAQNVHFDWAKDFGGTGSISIGSSIATDAAGNVYTTGSFAGTVDFDPGPGSFLLTSTNTTYGDIFVSKLDPSGNFVWAKQMKAVDGGGIGLSIALDGSGNVYVFGSFVGTIDFDPGPGVFLLTNPESSFILKLDAAGNFVWAEQFNPGTQDERDHSMKVDAAGNIFMTGAFKGNIDFDPGPAVSNMVSGAGGLARDAFILKLNTNGNFIWSRQFGGSSVTGAGEGISISLDLAGNIYTTGYYSGTFDFDPGPGVYNLTSGAQNMYISKLDPSGNFVWANQVNATAEGITVDNAGNVYTTGLFSNTADFDPGAGVYDQTALGNKDLFLLKLDQNGNFIWAEDLGGTGEASGYSLALDMAGNVFMTGTFKGTIVFNPGTCLGTFTSTGSGDIFVTEIKADGTLVWVKQFAGAGYNAGSSIVVDIFGGICTTGFFAGTVDFDPGIGVFDLTSPGNYTAFVQKMILCTNSTSSALNISSCGSYAFHCQTYTSSGVYQQVISNATGCDSIVTLNITINTTSFATITNIAACNNYYWNGKSFITSGTYIDTLTASTGCDSILTLNLTINPQSVSVIKHTICPGQSFSGYTEAGTYTDTLASAVGCDSIRTIQLSVMDLPVPDLGNNKDLCIGDTMILFPGNFDSYAWQDGSTQSHYVINKGGSYAVNVTNQCGSAQAQIAIAENKCGIYFPSAFTPNKDGKNDLFKILHPPDLSSYNLSIFNRWGQKVFETRDYSKGWDGTVNGLAQSTGVFVWFCKYKKTNSLLNGEISGTVVLIR